MVAKVSSENSINAGSKMVVPFWILLIFVLTFSLKLYSILPLTEFATEVQYPLLRIYAFAFFEDLSLLATVLVLWFLFARIRLLAHLFIVTVLFLYLADTLLIHALFSRLTIKQLFRYGDELPAVLTFLSWWQAVVLLAVVTLIWLTRKLKIRLRPWKPLVILPSLLIAALPWFLSGSYAWDPYIDYAFCNVLRLNSKVVLYPGVSTKNFQQVEAEFSNLAQKLTLDLDKRLELIQLNQDKTLQNGKNNPKPNIILVLSESLSRIDSKRSGGLYNRLPLIDEMASHGITMTDVVANGNNTSEALVSLLTGDDPFPTRFTEDALLERFPPLNSEQGSENLISHAKKNGYKTLFISNAPLSFQQNRLWLKKIGFDRVEGGESVFFKTKPKGSFGAAPDQYLYDRALSLVKRQRQPYFLVLMTISLHRPYLVPEEAERISPVDFHNLLHYVDQTTYGFWEKLNQSRFFTNGRLLVVGDHRRMTPLEPLEFQKTGVDSFGRVFGCFLGKNIPTDSFAHSPLNLNDIMNILWVELSGRDIDYTSLDRFNKGFILGMGFPFTTHLLNIDLAQIQIRIPERNPEFITFNRWVTPSKFVNDPQMQKVVAYMILNAGKLDKRQREYNESLERTE